MKKYIYKIISLILVLLIPSTTFAAIPVTQPINGGTGTSSIPVVGQVLVGQANGTYAPQATSTLGISGGGGTGVVGTTTDNYNIFTTSTGYSAYNQNNGFTDSQTTLDQIITDIKSNMGTASSTINLGAGVFVDNSGFIFNQGNIAFKGQGIGVTTLEAASTTALNTAAILQFIPSTNTCTALPLTTDAGVGSTTIIVSPTNAATLNPGDYIILYSSLGIDTEFTGRNQGELHQIVSVNAGTGVITLAQTNTNDSLPVLQTTTIANSANICKLNFVNNITISDMTITDLSPQRPSGLQLGALNVEFARNVNINNVQFTHVFDSGVLLWQDWDTRVSNVQITNVLDEDPPQNLFYGIQVRGATLNTEITGNTFGSMRHAVTQGAGGSGKFAGITRNLDIVGNTAEGTFVADFDNHQGSIGCNISGNTMTGDDTSANGIQTRSPCTIVGNNITAVLGVGISLFGAASGSNISNNVITGGSVGIQASNGVRQLTINGNTINGGTHGVLLNRTANTVTISIASPAVINYPSHAISIGTELTFQTTGALPTGILPNTNYYVIAAGIDPNDFEISTTLNGSAVNTTGTQSGTQTAIYYSGTDSSIINNKILNETLDGINANGQLRVQVNNNTFQGNNRIFNVQDTDSRISGWQFGINYFQGNTLIGNLATSTASIFGNYNTNGNFGINTLTPSTTLQVYGTTTTNGLNLPNLSNTILAVDTQGNVIATTTSSNAGTVTLVSTDATLTGGPITNSGTLGLNLATTNAWSAPILANGGIDLTNGGTATATSTITGNQYAYQTNDVLNTGTTTIQVIASTTIKGNSMGPNGFLQITGFATTTNSADNKVITIKFGGQTFQAITLSASQIYMFQTQIFNQGATNVQISPSSPTSGTSSGAPKNGTVDTTQDQPLTVSCTLSVSTSTCSMLRFAVQIIK